MFHAADETLVPVPETYAPTLLRKRAALLSSVTGKTYRAAQDAKKPLNIVQLFKTSLTRPWQLLFREPVVIAVSTYMAIASISLKISGLADLPSQHQDLRNFIYAFLCFPDCVPAGTWLESGRWWFSFSGCTCWDAKRSGLHYVIGTSN